MSIKQQFPLATLDMIIQRIKLDGSSTYFSMLNELPNEKFYVIIFKLLVKLSKKCLSSIQKYPIKANKKPRSKNLDKM
jgi:hypothetical protein